MSDCKCQSHWEKIQATLFCKNEIIDGIFAKNEWPLILYGWKKMYICVNENNLITIALWVNPEELFEEIGGGTGVVHDPAT